MERNRPIEAREHLRRFHTLFFAYAPDKAAIESNIERALVMADRSAVDYYRDLAESGYFNRLIAAGIIQRIEVDSIAVDFERYPYRARTYARQIILRESTVTERSLVTTCQMVNSIRSTDNPQGFQIQRLTVVENRDLGSNDR